MSVTFQPFFIHFSELSPTFSYVLVTIHPLYIHFFCPFLHPFFPSIIFIHFSIYFFNPFFSSILVNRHPFFSSIVVYFHPLHHQPSSKTLSSFFKFLNFLSKSSIPAQHSLLTACCFPLIAHALATLMTKAGCSTFRMSFMTSRSRYRFNPIWRRSKRSKKHENPRTELYHLP